MKKLVLAAAVSLIASTSAHAENRDILSYDKAATALSACTALASKNKWNMSVVIVDRSADPLATARMTDALEPSYTGATLKASSSVAWGMPTDGIEDFIKDKPQFRAFPGLLTIAGGLPLFSENKTLIGAVGVAGSAPANDKACAQAIVDALK